MQNLMSWAWGLSRRGAIHDFYSHCFKRSLMCALLQVIDDVGFDKLCIEAIEQQGRLKLWLFKKIEAQDYEMD